MTQQSLATVQNQVSTGLSVASAADNSSYWAIAAQLNADSGIVTASNSAMSEGQSVLATASSAINSVVTTLNSMMTALTQAQNPGAQIGDINTSLASLGQQLQDAVNGASFNGLNVLNGSQNTLSFVAGFNASATGGSINTISFAAQALTGGAATTPTTTTTQSTITDPTTIANIAALTHNERDARLRHRRHHRLGDGSAGRCYRPIDGSLWKYHDNDVHSPRRERKQFSDQLVGHPR